jgi:hypothetical protein
MNPYIPFCAEGLSKALIERPSIEQKYLKSYISLGEGAPNYVLRRMPAFNPMISQWVAGAADSSA